MRKGARTLSVLLLAAAFTTGIHAGGQQDAAASEGPVTLKIYAQYSDDSEKLPYDYAEQALAMEMPDVKLELDIRGQDDDMRLRTYAAAGNLPDIYQANTTIIGQFIESGDIALLDDYVAEAGLTELVTEAAIPSLFHEDGHTYAIPTSGKYASAMYYNKDLFAQYGVKVPENFEEMEAAIKVFAENDVIPLAIFAKENWPGVQLYDMLVTRQQPGGLLKIDSGANSITEEAYKDAAVKLERLVDAGLMARGAFNTSYDEALALFTEGQAAMFLNGMWCVKDLGERMSDSVDILPYYYPLADAGQEGQSEWHMSGGSVKHDGLSANSGSSHQELASRVTVFFAHKYAEGKTVKMGFPPLFTDTPETEVSLTPIHLRALQEAVNYKSTSGFPWHIATPETRTAIEDGVARMLTGDYSADEFIRDLDKLID